MALPLKWSEVIALPEWGKLNMQEQVQARAHWYDTTFAPSAEKDGISRDELNAVREYEILNFDNGVGKIATFSKSLLQGAAGTVTGAVQGVGALTGSESVEEAGAAGTKYLQNELTTDPRAEFTNTAGSAVGNMIPIIATAGAAGVVAKGLGAAAPAVAAAQEGASLTTAFLAGAGEGASRADQLGMTGPEKYMRTLAGGALEVATEKIPFGLGAELGVLRRGAGTTIVKAVGTEAAEEALAQVGGNIADIALAPEGAKTPGLLEGVGMAAFGGAFGGGVLGTGPAIMRTEQQLADGDPAVKKVLADAAAASTQIQTGVRAQEVKMPELETPVGSLLPEGALEVLRADPEPSLEVAPVEKVAPLQLTENSSDQGLDNTLDNGTNDLSETPLPLEVAPGAETGTNQPTTSGIAAGLFTPPQGQRRFPLLDLGRARENIQAAALPPVEEISSEEDPQTQRFTAATQTGQQRPVAQLNVRPDDLITLGDGTEARVEAVTPDAITISSPEFGTQVIPRTESIGVQDVKPSLLNSQSPISEQQARDLIQAMGVTDDVQFVNDGDTVDLGPDVQASTEGGDQNFSQIRVQGQRGFRTTVAGKPTVFLNRDRITADTPIHEVTHGWIETLPADIRTTGEKLMRQSGARLLADVRSRYSRSGQTLNDAGVMEEALVSLMGIEGQNTWNRYVKSGAVRRAVQEWVARVKTWFRDTFGLSADTTVEQWARMQQERFLGQRSQRVGLKSLREEARRLADLEDVDYSLSDSTDPAPSQDYSSISPADERKPTGMASGAMGPPRVRQLFERDQISYGMETAPEAADQAVQIYEELVNSEATFQQMLDRLEGVHRGAGREYYNMTAPALFGLMLGDLDRAASDPTATVQQREDAERNIYDLETYEAEKAADKGQAINGYKIAWRMASAERQVRHYEREFQHTNTTQQKEHDNSVRALAGIANDYVKEIADAITNENIAAQLFQVAVAENAGVAAGTVIEDSAAEPVAAMDELGADDLLQQAIDSLGESDLARWSQEYLQDLYWIGALEQVKAQRNSAQSLSDYQRPEVLMARAQALTNEQIDSEIGEARKRLEENLKLIRGTQAKTKTAPVAADASASERAVAGLNKTLENLIDSEKKQSKAKTQSDAEIISEAIQQGILSKAGLPGKPSKDMALTIGLLIANKDIAKSVLEQVHADLQSKPETKDTITREKLDAFGKLVIGEEEAGTPYSLKQVSQLLRAELKKLGVSVTDLLKNAALGRAKGDEIEASLRDPDRGLQKRLGSENLDELVRVVRQEFDKTLAQRVREDQIKRGGKQFAQSQRARTKQEAEELKANGPPIREALTDSGTNGFVASLRRAIAGEPEPDGPLNAADKSLNAELSRIIREAVVEGTDVPPTAPVDRLISILGLAELRADKLERLDGAVQDAIDAESDPVKHMALREAWAKASAALGASLVSRSTASRLVYQAMDGKMRRELREMVSRGDTGGLSMLRDRVVKEAQAQVRSRIDESGLQALETPLQIELLRAPLESAFDAASENERLRSSQLARIALRKEALAEGRTAALSEEERAALDEVRPGNLLEYAIKNFGYNPRQFAADFVKSLKGERNVQAAVEKLAAQLGLTGAQARKFTIQLTQRTVEEMPEIRRKELEKKLKSRMDKELGRTAGRPRKKSDVEMLVNAIELGAFDASTFDKALLSLAKMKEFSPEFRVVLKDLVTKVNDPGITETQRNRYRTAIAEYIQAARGVSAMGLVGDIVMSHIFGGIGTMKINATAGGVKLFTDATVAAWAATASVEGLENMAISDRMVAAAAIASTTKRGFAKQGRWMATKMLKEGVSPVKDDQNAYGSNSFLEVLARSPDADIVLPGGVKLSKSTVKALIFATNLHKFVRRLMAATDLVYRAPGHELIKSQQAVLAIRSEAESDGGRPLPKTRAEWVARMDEVNYGRPFKEARADAERQADLEISEKRLDPALRYERIGNLLDGMLQEATGMTPAQRLEMVQEKAKRFTFANRTPGVLGGLAESLKSLTSNIPGMRLLLPAINVPINSFNQALDWTPYGFLRSWIGSRSLGEPGNRPPTLSVSRYIMQRWSEEPRAWQSLKEVVNEAAVAEMRYKAVVGSTILTGFLMLMAKYLSDDDDKAPFYITARGPGDPNDNKNWRDRGFKPYHIYFNGFGFNYLESPAFAVLTPLGAWNDVSRYSPNDTSSAEKAAFTMGRSLASFSDTAVLQSAGALLSVFSTDQQDQTTIDKLKKVTARFAGNLVAPNAGREVNQFLYGRQSSKDQSWMGNALATIPFVYSVADNRPALNVFGEPLTKTAQEDAVRAALPIISHRLVTSVIDDPQLHFVSRNGINAFQTRRRMLDGTEVMDNYEVTRRWVQESGRQLRAALSPEYMNSIDRLRESDPDKAEEEFDKLVARVRKQELDAIPGVAPVKN